VSHATASRRSFGSGSTLLYSPFHFNRIEPERSSDVAPASRASAHAQPAARTPPPPAKVPATGDSPQAHSAGPARTGPDDHGPRETRS
jgi:hypothetical protein